MPGLRLVYEADAAIAALNRTTQRGTVRVTNAMRSTAAAAQKQILERGRSAIPYTRWRQALQVNVEEGPKGEFIVQTSNTEPGFRNFQFGGIVKGKPLLWIPLSFSDAKGTPASQYPGRLFSVKRKQGAPLLMSAEDRRPKYFGAEQVNVPKKFRVVEVIEEVARELGTMYRTAFRAAEAI